MTTCFQTALPLRIAQRTVFLGVDVVRAMRGCDAETVFSMVDNGELRWVFDISLDQDTRELRFWPVRYWPRKMPPARLKTA